MENPRKYGKAPYSIAVIHGGPGAPGEMAPVARAIRSQWSVLEPFQTADTLEGQVEEHIAILEKHADLPVTLIGYSWGAWLSFIVAARFPSLLKRLILVSSGPFEEGYAHDIMNTRLDRLGNEEKKEVISFIESFNDAGSAETNKRMKRFGLLISKADAYDPMPHDDEVLETQFDIFQRVWREAEQLRNSGRLLEIAAEIQCPVIAIHGDHDPHPAEGVRKPLSHVLEDFRFVLLKNCGHTPWFERQAKDEFFRILREELGR
jgi:pimeloyl-ACP methyl ester carboxylesterase